MKKRNLNRRDFLRLSAAVATGAVMAACKPAAPPAPEVKEKAPAEKEVEATPKPAEKVHIVYQNRAVEEGAVEARKNSWAESYPVFQEKNPNIEVEFRNSPPEHWDKLMAAFTAGNAPDIYELCCTQSYKVVEMGQALNIQPYVDRDLDELLMDDYYPEQFKPWKDDAGDIHAMPRDSGAQLLYYNVDMFEEEGVDLLPKDYEDNINHDDFDEIGLQFVRREKPMRWATSSYGLGAGWNAQYHLWAFGGNMVDPDNRDKCALNTEEAKAALEWARAAVWDKYTFAYGEQMGGLGCEAAFMGERSATVEMGPWNLLPWTKSKFKWDLAPLPDGPTGLHTGFNSVDAYQGWSGTKYPDATWELLKFLASYDHEKPYCKYTYRQPCPNSLNEYWVKTVREKEPRMEEVNMELYAKARKVGHPEEMFHNDGVCKSEILKPAFDKVMLLGKEPVSFIAPFCELVNRFNAGEIGVEDIGTELEKLGA
ncbi:MAG: substrate-binding domain-containing protein [Chloroflexota bacterium]|nr:substrate-binding domain-containing protein [Chloroflexota bacterium]